MFEFWKWSCNLSGEPGSFEWFWKYSLIIAVISIDVSKTYIFRSSRYTVRAKSNFLGKLVSCAYCLSHWLALFVCIYHWVNILNIFIFVS